MIILVIIGAVSLILGLFLMADPKLLGKFINQLNKVIIETRPPSLKQNKLLGIFLIVFSLVMFYIGMKLK